MLSVTLSSLSGTSLKLGSVVFPSPRVNIWFYYQPCCRTVFRIGSHTGWWGPKLVHNTVKETRSYRGTGSYIKIRGKFVFLFSCVDHNTEETSQLFCFFFFPCCFKKLQYQAVKIFSLTCNSKLWNAEIQRVLLGIRKFGNSTPAPCLQDQCFGSFYIVEHLRYSAFGAGFNSVQIWVLWEYISLMSPRKTACSVSSFPAAPSLLQTLTKGEFLIACKIGED